ncbi:MAG TPA: DUF1573 domain-containing protein, partial [Thermoplasmatales archaeon]|nr:DUF1573 domain-containing protein [Thermoplasmatales archaeon]
GESTWIEFDALVVDGGVNVNVANVTAVEGCDMVLYCEDSATVFVPSVEPQLSFDPSSHDFGEMEEGETSSTTFEVWNNGGGTLQYNITSECDWVSVSPISGNSTGEHDTITVYIDTSGLSKGLHTCDVLITSNGGSGVFTVTVNVTWVPELSYSPTSHNFGEKAEGETDSTTFSVWNSGSGLLEYELLETCEWVTVSPLDGESTGEHDTITVSIDTTGLTEGLYTCDISITSNGGNGIFTVRVTVFTPHPPSVEIVKPEKNSLYFRNDKLMPFLGTVIIGPIIVQANATDPDGDVERVEFIVDGEVKHSDSAAPYSWLWNERVFGRRTIRVVAYDNHGLTGEDEINVIIFNLGISSVEEKGVVKGKVTEAGKLIKKGLPDVTVTAYPAPSGESNSTTTGKIPFVNRGEYTLLLTEGVYNIEFKADGYQTHVETGVVVTSGSTTVLNVALQPVEGG